MFQPVQKFIVNTPLGPAVCWGVDPDDTVELGLRFFTWQIETGESWTWRAAEVRIGGSVSAARSDVTSPIHVSDDMLEMLIPHIRRHTLSPFYWKVNQ
jgi:hypothetical protein